MKKVITTIALIIVLSLNISPSAGEAAPYGAMPVPTGVVQQA